MGAWDPDQTEMGKKDTYEPLIDRATFVVESTASREFLFTGVYKKTS